MRLAKMAAATAAALIATQGLAQEQFFTIGTGGQTGVYFVVGQSICRLVNRGTDEHGLRCTAPSTGASIANINAIASQDMEMGVAQSDSQWLAYNGVGQFEGDQVEGLRSVFSVHPEPFTVLARADSGIETFDDLQGKRVNVGNPGSGTRATMEVIMDAKGWTMDDFALASELQSAEQAQALCDNNVDAIIFAVGHPNGSIQEATSSCDARLIPVTGPEIDQLVADNPYYSSATIPGGMYPGNPEPTEVFGVRATMVSGEWVDDEIVYQTTKAVFDNLDRFKRLHPAFENLVAEEMIEAGLSAPLHAGAQRYYDEQGWTPGG